MSGDQRTDWTNHAATAEACVVDEMPTENILNQWKHLGVRILKRIAWDPECSAEYVRRRVGFLAVHDEADGVWLVGEESFPESWKQALAEAKIDVDVALYCRELAREALDWKAKDHRVWIEGRRVMWFLKFMDFDSENLDTLRLEFVCYSKRLEQLLGKPERNLPLAVAQPLGPDGGVLSPLAGRDVRAVPVSIDGRKDVLLSEGLSFRCDDRGFGFTIASGSGKKDVWPGGRASFRLYLSDGQGAYLPYEFKIDLSPIESGRAPTDAYGLWFLEERWGKGKLRLYADSHSWRLKPVPRRSYGAKYPRLDPRFDFRWQEQGGWTLNLRFTWLSVYGFWPSVRNGSREQWYVSLDALPGVPAAACRLDWAQGREANFKKLRDGLSRDEITASDDAQKQQVRNTYRLWHEERLYGYARTAKPTYQRCDTESDRVFWERIVEPMMAGNRRIADILTFAERVSAARRDYILLRFAGKLPPEPPKEEPEDGAAAPDADADDSVLQLDDKEL